MFNGKQIRVVCDDESEKTYYSVVDVIEALTETDRPRKYWSDFKKLLMMQHGELSDFLGQLKLPSSDGKYYNTDVADSSQLASLVQLIPSENTQLFITWLAGFSTENPCLNTALIMQQVVHNKIFILRGCNVMTDADVAELYGVDTKRINEAVKNNPDKFPEDYMFTPDSIEIDDLRSKFSTANLSTMSRVTPKVFTEKGLYMLATILKSNKAREATFAIIETFAKVRYLKKEIVSLHEETDPARQKDKLQRFGEVISDIVMPDLQTTETESSLELNFFIGKLKHTVKRVKKKS